MGGQQATEELVELCFIDETASVLDVGCGVGLTARYLATEIGCSVVGVDISSRMIVRAEEYASRAGVSDRVRFRTADIEELPFEDDRFDAVLIESVVSLLEEKDQAIAECVRVARPGGYVGFNETIWVAIPLVIRTYKPDIRGELRNTIRRIGFRDLLKVWGRAFRLYRRDPAYRDFVQEALSEPREMLEYMGRGMFVGRKSPPLVI
jgi:ubiquinone/menaquinone biosynthesis C-methylase UbiE